MYDPRLFHSTRRWKLGWLPIILLCLVQVHLISFSLFLRRLSYLTMNNERLLASLGSIVRSWKCKTESYYLTFVQISSLPALNFLREEEEPSSLSTKTSGNLLKFKYLPFNKENYSRLTQLRLVVNNQKSMLDGYRMVIICCI